MKMRRFAKTCAGLAIVLCAGAGGMQAWAQEEQYPERQVLDPTTDEWVDQAPPTPETPTGELDLARSHLARGESKRALGLLKDWCAANPDHERYLEGVYYLGEAYFERKDYYKAYEQYEIVVESAAGDLFQKALTREVEVARAFLSGEKRIVWKILRFPAYEEALDILSRVWERVPGTQLGEVALRLRADYLFGNGEMDSAQLEYANLAQQYPRGRYVRIAMLRSAEAADAAFPGILFDDRQLVEADERYRQLRAAYPEYASAENVDTRLEGIRQQRAEKDLEVARWYQQTKQPGAAEYYYRLILRDWPGTLAAEEARGELRGLGVEPERQESGA